MTTSLRLSALFTIAYSQNLPKQAVFAPLYPFCLGCAYARGVFLPGLPARLMRVLCAGKVHGSLARAGKVVFPL